MTILSEFPPCEKSFAAVLDVIAEAAAEGRVGCDFEGHHPLTIIGVASRSRMAAWWWDARLGQALVDCKATLVAYAGIGADKPQLERALGVTTPLDRWLDPMIYHWCLNPDLSSIPKSTVGEDSDAHVMGHMSLWSCTSLLHDFPHWKGRRDEEGRPHCIDPEKCRKYGGPCSSCDELSYCAADAFAGLWDQYALEARLTEVGVDPNYPKWRASIAEVCATGFDPVRFDPDVIEGLEAAIQSRKATLFPFLLDHSGKPRKKKVTVFLAEYGDVAAVEYEKKSMAPKVWVDGTPRTRLEKVTTVVEIAGKPRSKPVRVWQGPFNPNSPKAVIDYFDSHEITLRERGGKPSAGKQVVLARLDRELRPYGLKFNPKTAEIEGDDTLLNETLLPEPVDLLLRLAQKTCASKGVKSWFDSQYVLNNTVKPRFNSCGTVTGRLSSHKPNFQNVGRVGFLGEIRRAIIARPGKKIVKADLSQLEFRVCLWFAGLSPDLADGAFDLLTSKAGEQFDEAAKRLGWKRRDVAKSLIHGGDYLEGLKLMTDKDLSNARIAGDRKAGALLVFDGQDRPEWRFRGRYVTFTGANLSERLFGDRTRENRAKALALQRIYMDEFKEIQQFQRRVGQEIETSREIRLPSGHRVPLYGRQPEDDLKFAAACVGQGGGAIYAEEGLIHFHQADTRLLLAVHDEAVCEVPESWDNETCAAHMFPMVKPSMILNNFWCPAKVAVGPNWKDAAEIGTIRWTGNQLAFKSV